MMDDPLLQAAERGEVVLGGCIVPEDPVPQWHCTSCDRDVHLSGAPTDA